MIVTETLTELPLVTLAEDGLTVQTEFGGRFVQVKLMNPVKFLSGTNAKPKFAIGIPAALLCVRFVESQLYEVKGITPTVLGIAIMTLLVAPSLAGLIPPRRAASTDPAQTLRTE